LIRIYLFLTLVVFTGCKNGESVFSKNKGNRPSPPASAIGKIGTTDVRIDFSSPRVRDRKIWDDLVPYGKIWRTGANEASTLSVNNDLIVGGEILPKGKYSVFTIPNQNEWTVIINKVWDLWGSYDYSEEKDAMRISVIPYKLDEKVENMTFKIESDKIVFNWESLGFTIPVKSTTD